MRWGDKCKDQQDGLIIILLSPIQLMCLIFFYGQVILIVQFLFLVWVLTFMPLVDLSYFQLYPSLPILIFLPYIKNPYLFSTLRVPLLTLLKIHKKSNETLKVNRKKYYNSENTNRNRNRNKSYLNSARTSLSLLPPPFWKFCFTSYTLLFFLGRLFFVNYN